MIAAGGPGDREVRYVIKIAADPGNAAVVARETAQLRAFEQRVAQVGASAGRTFANRFGGGGTGGGLPGGVSLGNGGGGGGGAGLPPDPEARIADMQRRLATLRTNIGTLEWGGMSRTLMRVGGWGALAAGVGVGAVSAIQGYTGYRGPGSIPEYLGGHLLSQYGNVLGGGATMLGRSVGLLGDDDYAVSSLLPGSATYASNQRAAALQARQTAQERFRAARGLWDMENSSITGARASARFDAALARARATGDFSGVQALSRSDMGAARRQLDGASGDAIGPAAKEYVSALERESQLIRENASARETLSQKMGDEIARMQQLQANRGSIAERYLRADPAERSLLNRAAAGDLATLSDRELLQAGNLGYNSPAYLAEAERRAKAQGLSTPQLDARIDAARSAAETFKQQLETGLGRSLGPLDEAFGKAGEAIGEIVAKKLAENTEQMVEAVQKALDARAAQNVNKGQAMLRRSQQVGLS